jgi:ERCC4-related helicase
MIKIKPIIKTHWVSSQNPLNVDLGEVVGVGLELSEKLWMTNLQLAEKAFAVSMPAAGPPQMFQKPVPEREVARNLILKAQLSDGLIEGDLYSRLVQSLLIETKTGEIVPAVKYLREQNLPQFVNPLCYFEDRGVNWERLNSDFGQTLKKALLFASESPQRSAVEMIFVVLYEIMAWSFQRKRQIGDLEVFAISGKQKTILHELLIHQTLDFKAHLEKSTGPSSLLSLQIHAHAEAKNDDLQIFQVDEYVELTQKLLELGELQPRNSQSCFRLAISNLALVPKALEIATPFLRTKSDLEVEVHEKLLKENFDLTLKIWDQEGNAELELWLFGKKASENESLSVFHLLNYWFSNFQNPMKLDLPPAAKKKPPSGHDYLLFNHHGASLFIWLELLNYYLDLPMTSGQKLEKQGPDIQEPVLRYLKSVMPSLLGKNESTFGKIFSESAAQYFSHIIEVYLTKIQSWRPLVFHGAQGMVDVADFKNQFLSVVRLLLLQIFEESQGKLFLRSQFTGKGDLTPVYLKQLLESTSASSRTRWGKFNFATWEMLFELNDQGTQLFYNDKVITSDTALDFVFSVTDASSLDEGKSQWFDLHPEIFFNGVKVDNQDLNLKIQGQQFGFVEYKGQIYRIDKKQLPNLKTLQRFWRRLQIKSAGGGFKGNQMQTLRLERSRALELLMLKQLGIKVEVSGSWQKVFDYFDKGLGANKLDFPPAAANMLLDHQKQGAQWLWDLYNLHLGAILADEMGLGKTFQILAFLSTLREKKELGKCLIIVPTSLLYNWLEEEKKFQLKLPVCVLNGLSAADLQKNLASSAEGIFLSTYGYLIENDEQIQKTSWNVVVFDEAQALKNVTSQRTLAAKKLRAKFKVCLTGTPMENNYIEFFSLCDLVVPGCLGELSSFRREFRSLEVRHDLIRELKLTSKPLLLRRTKKQVELNLPEKVLHEIRLPFEAQQKDIYKQMAMTFSRQVEKLIQDQGESKAQISMFSALMRLRQICSDPSAVPGVSYKGKPAKVEHFIESIEEHIENGDSVIVFTQFLATLERLKKELSDRGVEHYLLKGSISSQERLNIIGQFNKSENAAVMLMTLKTGGVGLNLTKASVVYHMEPWWNPAVENQATDRAHRMGQTKNVRVFNLLIEGSLEQRISELKVKKQAAFDKLFSDDQETLELDTPKEAALSKEDFFYLLSEENPGI